MIKATELRINSIVRHTNENGTFEFNVSEILARGVNVIHNGGIWFIKYEDLIPIPLTEEWFLKFGFEEKPFYGRKYFEKNDFKIKAGENGWFDYFIDIDYGNDTKEFASFKYVHRLQNLYFELKDEELTLKEIV